MAVKRTKETISLPYVSQRGHRALVSSNMRERNSWKNMRGGRT